jgi:hypothetical protein
VCPSTPVRGVPRRGRRRKRSVVWSASAPRVFWWIPRSGGAKLPLTGARDDKHLAMTTSPVSPDGRYLALAAWQQRASGKGQQHRSAVHRADRVVRFIDRTGAGTDGVLSVPGESVDVVGWTGKGTATRAIARVGRIYEQAPDVMVVLIDPAPANTVSRDAPAPDDDSLSPDGEHRCAFRADGTELAGRRHDTSVLRASGRRALHEPSELRLGRRPSRDGPSRSIGLGG